MKRVQFIVEQGRELLTPFLPAIQNLADSEREALGFLPAIAFEEAMVRRRLLAAWVQEGNTRIFAGFLLYSGVFPNAKIQQIAAVPEFRKRGAASALLKALVAQLEHSGFLGIRADVATDLPVALAFYAKHGFEKVLERSGGTTRGRTIAVHRRTLETENLFTIANQLPSNSVDMGTRRRNQSGTPIFAFDLNIYFDLVRQRTQSEKARRLFGEALGHTIRLAVADEFISELRRTSNSLSADPVLQMALQIPRLPKADAIELEALASRIHQIVFMDAGHGDAGSENSKSDARHLAHAALAKASAFVTRDGAILSARQELLKIVGIDIATVDEVLDLLPPEISSSSTLPLHGDGFEFHALEASAFADYCRKIGLRDELISEFIANATDNSELRRSAIWQSGRVVAVAALRIPKGIDPVARLLVHVRQEQQEAELFADFLLESSVRSASEGAPTTIELLHLGGQSIVNRLAAARAFHRTNGAYSFTKVAVGRALTSGNWKSVVQQIRRRTGLVLPDSLSGISGNEDSTVQLPSGAFVKMAAATLEDLIGPTIIAWTGRSGVMVPITRRYADDLLGTSDQSNLGFIINRDASFLSTRGYVNSPRTAKLLRPGLPIVFYESKREGKGRGAAVAVARITSSVVFSKEQLNAKPDKRLVIEDPEVFSASDDVLLTSFDNLLTFQSIVGLKKLRELNATGQANLRSAVSLTSEQLTSILTCGWSSERKN